MRRASCLSHRWEDYQRTGSYAGTHRLFKEQIDLGVIGFELLVLAIVGLLAIMFVPAWQREIKVEIFSLYYTMGAAAGGLSLSGLHWDKVLLFYGLGVFVPWLMFVRVKVPFFNLD